MSGQCYACGAEFGFFKKEVGGLESYVSSFLEKVCILALLLSVLLVIVTWLWNFCCTPQSKMQLVECSFTCPETVGLFGTGAQDDHLDFHASPELRKCN